MNYTNNCSAADFNQLRCFCDGYEAYFDDEDASYITYIAAYFNTTLVGFISCITPDFSITDDRQVCFVEITAMVHPDHRHKKIFSNLLFQLHSIIKKLSNQFNKENNSSVSVQFICTINDKKAKKYHLALHSCEYLMILNDTNVLNHSNPLNTSNILDNFPQKALAKKFSPSIVHDNYSSYFSTDKSCYMLFFNNSSSPIAVCELEYMPSYTCISSVYVDYNQRGKKIGTCLIKNLIHDYFKLEHKKQPLILHVSSTNPAAFQLYKNCGFSIREQVNYYYINIFPIFIQ